MFHAFIQVTPFWVLVLASSHLCAALNAVDETPDQLALKEKILGAWKERDAAVPNLHVVWDSSLTKEQIHRLNSDRSSLVPFTAYDESSRIKGYQLFSSGGKIAYRYNSSWNPTGAQNWLVFDGHFIGGYMAPDKQGGIGVAPEKFPDLGSPRIFIPLFYYQPQTTLNLFVVAPSISVQSDIVDVNGRPCYVVDVVGGEDDFRLYLDSEDVATLRKVDSFMPAKHQKHGRTDRDRWWTASPEYDDGKAPINAIVKVRVEAFHNYNEKSTTESSTTEIQAVDLQPITDPSVFDPANFPVGTSVSDQRNGQAFPGDRYTQGEGGERLPLPTVDPNDKPASTSASVARNEEAKDRFPTQVLFWVSLGLFIASVLFWVKAKL